MIGPLFMLSSKLKGYGIYVPCVFEEMYKKHGIIDLGLYAGGEAFEECGLKGKGAVPEKGIERYLVSYSSPYHNTFGAPHISGIAGRRLDLSRMLCDEAGLEEDGSVFGIGYIDCFLVVGETELEKYISGTRGSGGVRRFRERKRVLDKKGIIFGNPEQRDTSF